MSKDRNKVAVMLTHKQLHDVRMAIYVFQRRFGKTATLETAMAEIEEGMRVLDSYEPMRILEVEVDA